MHLNKICLELNKINSVQLKFKVKSARPQSKGQFDPVTQPRHENV